METEKEAIIIGKYLLGKRINNQAIALYGDAMEMHAFQSEPKDQRIQSFAFTFPFLMGMIDGGMALVLKQSVLRKKIFLMLAILETMPAYSEMFLSKKQNLSDFAGVFLLGIRGVFRGVFGVLLVKMI